MEEETIREAVTYCIHETPEGVIPLPFAYMLRSFAILLYLDAAQRIDKKPDPEILAVMSDQNILDPNNMRQFLQIQGFVKWWLSKPRTAFCKDMDGIDFANNDALVEAWNKFAEECDDS